MQKSSLTQTSKLSQITVAILAGGQGSRLVPALPNRQKVVAPIGNSPFLKYILSLLNKAGLTNIVICTGHLGSQVQQELGKTYKSLVLQYSQEPSPLGTAGAMRLALPLFESKDILVLNGDTFCNVDLNKFWEFHVKNKSSASLVLSEVTNASRFGTVKLDENKRIVKFEEKKPGGGLVSAGIYLINKNLISHIPAGQKISLEKEIFPKWIGKKFYGFKVEMEFIDIGTPESYKSAQEFFAKNKLK